MPQKLSIKKIIRLTVLVILLPALSIAGEEKASSTYEIINTYYYEDYSFTKDRTKGTAVSIVYKDPRGLTLFGENRHQEKFGRYEMLLKGGGAYRLTKDLSVQEVLGFSADKNTFPNFLSQTELDYILFDKLVLTGGYDLYMFNNITVNVFSEGVTLYPWKYIYLNAKFLHAITDFKTTNKMPVITSFLTKLGFYPDKNNEFSFLFSTDTESFLSIDQIGHFIANTYVLGWNGHLTGNWYLTLNLTYQDRRKPIKGSMKSIEFGFKYKW